MSCAPDRKDINLPGWSIAPDSEETTFFLFVLQA